MGVPSSTATPSTVEASTNRSVWTWIGGWIFIAGVLAWSWWELLFLPLGDSHDGRINGRFGLQIRNLFDDGLAGSSFLSSMEPFSTQPYAHHPPLINIVHGAVGAVLGQGEWQLHLIGFVSGLATVAALLWLARESSISAPIAVGVTAVVAATPMFWIYARLGIGMTLLVAYLALQQRRRRVHVPRRWALGAAGLVAFSSWPGAALVAFTAMLDLRHPGRRRTARLTLGLVAVVVGLILAWALAVSGAGEIAEHTASRLTLPVGLGDFVDQYRWFYRTLYPTWFAWTIPLWLALAVVDARTRSSAVALLAVLGAWTVGLPEAAFVHDYWTYPLLAVVAMGAMVGLERIVAAGLPLAMVMFTVGLLAITTFDTTQSAGYRQAYFEAPSDAGRLLQLTDPAPGQVVAWTVGLEVPRWVSWHWDVPAGEFSPETAAHPDDLVLVRLDRLTEWANAEATVVAGVGRYGLVRAEDLVDQ